MSYKKTITATTTTWGITPSSGYKSKVVIPTVYYANFAQIGDIIITDSDVLYNSGGEEVYSLLLADGSTFNGALYPELYAILGSNVLENLADVEGSPFPYKYVADFVENPSYLFTIATIGDNVDWQYTSTYYYNYTKTQTLRGYAISSTGSDFSSDDLVPTLTGSGTTVNTGDTSTLGSIDTNTFVDGNGTTRTVIEAVEEQYARDDDSDGSIDTSKCMFYLELSEELATEEVETCFTSLVITASSGEVFTLNRADAGYTVWNNTSAWIWVSSNIDTTWSLDNPITTSATDCTFTVEVVL